MAGWTPGKHKPTKEQGNRDDRPVPAGTYLLGVTWMGIRSPAVTKLGVKVLDGPMAGRVAFVPLFTNVEKASNANDVYYLSNAMGNAGLEWEFTEDWMRENLVGAAFKGRLSIETNGQYQDHKIKQAFPRDGLSQAEGELLLTWSDDFKQGRGSSSSSDSDFADEEGDDWAGGQDDDESGTMPGKGFPDDDDNIPF